MWTLNKTLKHKLWDGDKIIPTGSVYIFVHPFGQAEANQSMGWRGRRRLYVEQTGPHQAAEPRALSKLHWPPFREPCCRTGALNTRATRSYSFTAPRNPRWTWNTVTINTAHCLGYTSALNHICWGPLLFPYFTIMLLHYGAMFGPAGRDGSSTPRCGEMLFNVTSPFKSAPFETVWLTGITYCRIPCKQYGRSHREWQASPIIPLKII